MSSSSSTPAVTPLEIRELRTGEWTRYGTAAVLGDAITEETLSTLAESTRVAAGSQGYAVGWAEGQRAAREAAARDAAEVAQQVAAAEARRAAEHAAAIAALRAAATALTESLDAVCTRVEDAAGSLAYELTETLVGHQVAGPGVDVISRVLALKPGGPILRVRLHPADAAGATGLGVPVLADPALGRGEALVELDDSVLDLRLATALDRVRAALLDEEDR